MVFGKHIKILCFPAIANEFKIIGSTLILMLFYFLFTALRIHVSPSLKRNLDMFGTFHTEDRGATFLKVWNRLYFSESKWQKLHVYNNISMKIVIPLPSSVLQCKKLLSFTFTVKLLAQINIYTLYFTCSSFSICLLFLKT